MGNDKPGDSHGMAVLPAVSNDQVSEDLRWLTELLMKTQGAETTGGLLGGEFGYGAEFSNDVFEMHPYSWDDCGCGHDAAESRWYAENTHQPECYQSVLRDRGFIDNDDHEMSYRDREARNEQIVAQLCAEMGLDPEYGCLVHCTCDYQARWDQWAGQNRHDPACVIVRPNFLHKPTGSRVDWYKYIGRSMTVEVHGDWRAILTDCVASLNVAGPEDTNG